MARTKDRNRAIELRMKGYTYSQIKSTLGISKSTLSGWLTDLPLSKERLFELRKNDQGRIEKTRETKRKKKLERRQRVYEQVSFDIEQSKDAAFIGGFYLYWGEGTKTAEYTVSFTNSDPSMIRCFVDWMKILSVSPQDLKIKLHLYSDQSELMLKNFWSGITGVPLKNFNKSYIKETRSAAKTYKGMFAMGTCVLMYHNRDMYEYVLEGVKYLRKKYSVN